MRPLPTAPLAAGALIVGYAVATGTGSRPLGGVALLLGGAVCAAAWNRRHGARTAARLSGVGLGGFILSHVLALAVGAWPAVLLSSGALAAVVWTQADARTRAAGAPLAFPPHAR